MTGLNRSIDVGGCQIGNQHPMVLIGGVNVLESRELALSVAEAFVRVCQNLGLPYVFKASFDKANRSSIHSFRGPGLQEGLALLAEIKATFGVPVLTDIHEPDRPHPSPRCAISCNCLLFWRAKLT